MTGLLLLSLVAGTLSIRQIGDRIEERRSEMKRTRRELAQVEQKLAHLEERESAGLGRLEALREQSSVIRRYIAQLDSQLVARTQEIAATSRRIEETSDRIESLREDLARRLVGVYKYGKLLPLETLVSSKNLPRLQRRLYYLRWVARADRSTAEELDGLKAELASQRARLVNARAELDRLRQEQQEEREALALSEASEARLLQQIRTQRAAQARLEKEMNEAIVRLQEMIDALEQQRREQVALSENHYFVVNQGRLPWPAQGRIIAAFGSRVHPRYGTKTNNKGIDIETSPRTPVRAIWDGKVAFADQFTGYGRMVILDHDGGFYTLYGNLEEIGVTVGEQVMTAQPVGRSKESCHFEIRRQGQAMDPTEWLKQ